MKKYIQLSIVAALALSTGPAWAANILDFDGYYKIAPGSYNVAVGETLPVGDHWSLTAHNSSFTAQLFAQPSGSLYSMVLQLTGTGSGGYADLVINMPEAGPVSFDYMFEASPSTSGGKRLAIGGRTFGYLVDTTYTQAAPTPFGQLAHLDVGPAVAGKNFGFRLSTGADANALVSLQNFTAPAVPEAANTAMLLVPTLLGLIALRRRITG
jgi:hypothetical protein